MRNLTVIAIIVGIIALAGAAFAHGPGWGGWGGHMMAPGYHMDGYRGYHMETGWGPGPRENDAGAWSRGGYSPGYGWCYANPGLVRGWNSLITPENSPAAEE